MWFDLFFVIVCGTICFRAWIGHRERQLELRAMGKLPSNDISSADFQALRDEIARLRDTTTQYDMSVEASLREIKQRVGFLESRISASSGALQQASEPEHVAITAR